MDSIIAFNSAGDGAAADTCTGDYGNCVHFGFGGNGGGIFAADSTVELRNCTFYENRAGYGGFGYTAYLQGDDGSGGAIGGSPAGTTLINSILWNNEPAALSERGADGPVVTYSNVQQTYPGQGNISVDPRFVDPDGADNIAGTSDDDFRLFDASPCVNAGDATFLPEPGSRDLAGNPRLQGCRVDMGAFESSLSCGNCIEDSHCYDGVACTDDVCIAGTCRFIANTANCTDDGVYCNGTETCHPDLGCISSGSPCQPNEVCDEGNDSCGA